MKDKNIILYGDEVFFNKIRNILNKIGIFHLSFINEHATLPELINVNKNQEISFFIIHSDNHSLQEKYLLSMGIEKNNISVLTDFDTFMAILDFAGTSNKELIQKSLKNIPYFEKIYKSFIQTKFKRKKYQVTCLMNMVNFRTGTIDIAKSLDKKYKTINLFLDDKDNFNFKNKINLDQDKTWNNAIFNARLKYLDFSDVVISPSEGRTGKISVNCMHNSNYKPINKKLLNESILTPDYHLIPTKAMFKLHKKVLKENKKKLAHNVCLIPAGYPKLDKLISDLKNHKQQKKDSICYAPTLLMHNNDFKETLSLQDGKKIIDYLLKTFKKYNIIFRPHPNIKIYNHEFAGLNYIDDIIETFKDNKRFIYDSSPYYINTFSRSRVLISDYSSIMQTFSFATLRPFISLSSKNFSHLYKKNLGMKDDRHKTGLVIESFNDIKITIKYIIKNKNIYKKKIKKIREKEVFNIKNSVEYITDNFDYIIESKKNKDWYYAE